MTLEETRTAVREYRDRCRDKNLENHTADGIEIDPHTLTWAEYWLTKMSDEEDNMPMSPLEFEKKMSAITDLDDEEERHIKADNLLCECIRSFSENYEKGLRVFEDMKKWYS